VRDSLAHKPTPEGIALQAQCRPGFFLRSFLAAWTQRPEFDFGLRD